MRGPADPSPDPATEDQKAWGLHPGKAGFRGKDNRVWVGGRALSTRFPPLWQFMAGDREKEGGI